MVQNLRRTRQKWVWITWVLRREGEDDRTLGKIYLTAVKSVLLYRSETWVLTPCMQRVLGGYYHRATHRLTGRQTRKGRYRGWV